MPTYSVPSCSRAVECLPSQAITQSQVSCLPSGNVEQGKADTIRGGIVEAAGTGR